MKSSIINLIKKIRAILMRKIYKPKKYFKSRSVKPMSRRYGFDRGRPIDRYYIEEFLEENKEVIKGECLEVDNDIYTVRFGGGKIMKSDVLDVVPNNNANIFGDIRNLVGVIMDNSYDCIILTQTLNVVDDYEKSIKECYRILKPGGVLLATMPTISPTTSKGNHETNLWRFTISSAEYAFGKDFSKEKIFIKGFGNRKIAEYFWLGMAIEDIKREELIKNDPSFPIIVGIKAFK